MNCFIQPSLKKTYVILSLVLLIASCKSPEASKEIYAPGNKAINGYDAVAFFTDAKPVMGSDRYAYEWKNVSWNFASQQNLDAFKANPEKFAPQYGGYCAYGTAEGHKAPTKPETFSVVDGKLYFNYNLDVKKAWDKDRAALIEKADTAWVRVKNLN